MTMTGGAPLIDVGDVPTVPQPQDSLHPEPNASELSNMDGTARNSEGLRSGSGSSAGNHTGVDSISEAYGGSPQAPIQAGDAARTATEILGNTRREQAGDAAGTITGILGNTRDGLMERFPARTSPAPVVYIVTFKFVWDALRQGLL